MPVTGGIYHSCSRFVAWGCCCWPHKRRMRNSRPASTIWRPDFRCRATMQSSPAKAAMSGGYSPAHREYAKPATRLAELPGRRSNHRYIRRHRIAAQRATRHLPGAPSTSITPKPRRTAPPAITETSLLESRSITRQPAMRARTVTRP